MSALRLDVAVGGDATGYNRVMSGLGKTASNSLGNLKGMIAGAFTVGAITAFAKKTVEFAGHISDLSARIGVSTDYLQEMQFVMKQNGGSVDDLTVMFEKLGDAREKALTGDIGAMEDFAKLGVSEQDLKTKGKQDLLNSIAKSFEGGTSEALTGAFKRIGGKGAGALVPAFVDGLEAGRQKAKESGAVMSSETIAQLDAAGDAWDRFMAVVMGNVAPQLVRGMEIIQDAGDNLAAAFSYLGALFSNFDLMKIIKSNFTWEGIKSGGSVGEAARQLGSAEPAAQAAFDASVAGADARKVEAAKALDAKLALLNKPPEIPDYKPKIKPEIEKAMRGAPAFSDSLTSVGNFLGAGRASGLESIAKTHLSEAKKHTVLLDKLANKKTDGTILVPSS